MVQALCLSTPTAVVTARAGKHTVTRAKSVVARCVIFSIHRSIARDPCSSLHRVHWTLFAIYPRVVLTRIHALALPSHPNSAKPVVSAPVRLSKALPAALAATAPLFASLPAHAQNALFTVASLEDGNVDEETALYVLVGGSLAICTAVLTLVIGSDQFIKNFSKK